MFSIIQNTRSIWRQYWLFFNVYYVRIQLTLLTYMQSNTYPFDLPWMQCMWWCHTIRNMSSVINISKTHPAKVLLSFIWHVQFIYYTSNPISNYTWMTLPNSASIPLKNEQTHKLQIIDPDCHTRKNATQYESLVLQIATFESVSNFLLPFVFIISVDCNCSLLFLQTNRMKYKWFITNKNAIFIDNPNTNLYPS